MENACTATTGQTGPSFCQLITEEKFIVRQGKYLMKFTFGEDDPIQKIELPQFINNPCAVWNGKFFEIKQKVTYQIDIETFAIEGTHDFEFIQPTLNNPYIQFDQAIVILNGSYLYAVYLDEFKFMPIAELPSTEPHILMVTEFTKLFIGCSKTAYFYDTAKHQVSQVQKKEFSKGVGVMYDDRTYFVFGAVGAGLLGNEISKVALSAEGLPNVVYKHNAPLSRANQFISGPYCIISDNNGTANVLMDDVFQTISDRDSRLRFKTMAKFFKAQKEGDVFDEDGNPWSDLRTPENMISIDKDIKFTPGVPDFSKEQDEQKAYEDLLRARKQALENARQAELQKQREAEELKKRQEEEEKQRQKEIQRQIREAEEAAKKKAEEERRKLEEARKAQQLELERLKDQAQKEELQRKQAEELKKKEEEMRLFLQKQQQEKEELMRKKQLEEQQYQAKLAAEKEKQRLEKERLDKEADQAKKTLFSKMMSGAKEIAVARNTGKIDLAAFRKNLKKVDIDAILREKAEAAARAKQAALNPGKMSMAEKLARFGGGKK